MRVLQILHDRERGGIRTLSDMIEAGLSPHRFTFETEYLYPRAGLPAWSKFAAAIGMARRIWRRDFDALIAYQTTASILVGVIGWLSGCRIRIVHQTCTPSETAAPLRMLDMLVGSLGLYSVNIANSAATQSEFAHYPAAYHRSMILIEHGLDAPAPAHSRDETRRRFRLPPADPVLLNVGRLSTQKNQDVLIAALASLPQAHLVLAGDGLKGASLRAQAAALGVTERVHLPGALPAADIADLYLAGDLFVFPSTWETFGLAAVEAAMVGMPMVVADLPVLREVMRVDDAEPVDYVAPHDGDGWIAAIVAALASPPSPRAAVTFARAMRRKYSRQRMIESYLCLFRQSARSDREEPRRSAVPAPEEV